jgi:hypothetical protein
MRKEMSVRKSASSRKFINCSDDESQNSSEDESKMDIKTKLGRALKRKMTKLSSFE